MFCTASRASDVRRSPLTERNDVVILNHRVRAPRAVHDATPGPASMYEPPLHKHRHVCAYAFNPFHAGERRRQKKEDFTRAFEDDPFNPDDAWGSSKTNNVRPFFNFNKHAGQWAAEDEAHDAPHHESDFWYFNSGGTSGPTSSGSTRKKTTYYYHEYNHYYYYQANSARDRGGFSSGRSQRASHMAQQLGRPDLQLARRAVRHAKEAVASVNDIDGAESVIRREIERAVQYCALDVVIFAQALGCEATSARSAKRAIAMRYHPDKVSCVMEGDSEAQMARKRLEAMLGHSILSALTAIMT